MRDIIKLKHVCAAHDDQMRRQEQATSQLQRHVCEMRSEYLAVQRTLRLRVQSLEEQIDKEDEELVKVKQEVASIRKLDSVAYNKVRRKSLPAGTCIQFVGWWARILARTETVCTGGGLLAAYVLSIACVPLQSLMNGRGLMVSAEKSKERGAQTYQKYWEALEHITRLKADIDRCSCQLKFCPPLFKAWIFSHRRRYSARAADLTAATNRLRREIASKENYTLNVQETLQLASSMDATLLPSMLAEARLNEELPRNPDLSYA